MRASTAFNRILALPDTTVVDVTIDDDGDVIVDVELDSARLRCPCGYSSAAGYDSRQRRWRHLDIAGRRSFVQMWLRRLRCVDCGVRTEDVPWARPAARHTRAFEDQTAWLTQRCDKTTVATLMRCGWETIGVIARRVVADHLSLDRLDGLRRIGVDEVSYRRGHRYLTVVVDHDTARVVWVADGRTAAALREFYDALGDDRCVLLEAVSMDLGPTYWRATQQAAPQAVICLDPFHVMQLVHRALDRVFADATSGPDRLPLSGRARARARMLLRTGVEQLDADEHAAIAAYRRSRSKLFRAWELKEAIRTIYQMSGPTARIHLTEWLRAAKRSRIPAFVNLADTIQHNFDGIIAAIELGVSNSRVEGLNARIRLIHRRGYGYHTAAALSALIYLCCSKLPIALPTTT